MENIEINTKLYLNREEKTLHTRQDDDKATVLISVPGLVSIEEFKVPILGDFEAIPHVHRIDNVLIVQFRNVQVTSETPPQAGLLKLPCAKELQNSCNEFSCSNCGNCLIKLENGHQFIFKDLPNEHWLELLDCWSCHDNEFAPIAERALHKADSDVKDNSESKDHHDHHHHDIQNKKSYNEMNNSSNGLILPSEGKIYLGNGYVLMNRKDFDKKTCSNCEAEIGEFIQKTANIKIYRDSIKFKGIAEFPEETFLKLLMHKILDTIDNHSTFHFILKTTENGHKIYLRPIHWNLQFYDLNTGKWRIAFKLGFLQLTEASAAHIEAEIINCTLNQFNQIAKHLNYCHESLLFNSTFKIPGTDTLKLSYLID